MPRYCEHCGVDAPDAGQCGDVDGTRHSFIEGTFLSSHSFSITSAVLKLFLYLSSHNSIALDNLKSLYISHLISPTRLLLSVK